MMRTHLAHAFRFVFSGCLAFGTDVCVLDILTRLLGLPPLFARLISIGVAMGVGWLAHRSITFKVNKAPSWSEFGHYALMASTVAMLNYLLFALLLLAGLVHQPVVATAVASVIAMAASYIWMRLQVFRG